VEFSDRELKLLKKLVREELSMSSPHDYYDNPKTKVLKTLLKKLTAALRPD
jgi:hypothetical protein